MSLQYESNGLNMFWLGQCTEYIREAGTPDESTLAQHSQPMQLGMTSTSYIHVAFKWKAVNADSWHRCQEDLTA
jgi:hypothetical protein